MANNVKTARNHIGSKPAAKSGPVTSNQGPTAKRKGRRDEKGRFQPKPAPKAPNGPLGIEVVRNDGSDETRNPDFGLVSIKKMLKDGRVIRSIGIKTVEDLVYVRDSINLVLDELAPTPAAAEVPAAA
jgi:hypothetical protein